LLQPDPRRKLSHVEAKLYGAHIMNQISIATRLAQGFLAAIIVFAIGVVFQLSLIG
jgi:hypothetical protein